MADGKHSLTVFTRNKITKLFSNFLIRKVIKRFCRQTSSFLPLQDRYTPARIADTFAAEQTAASAVAPERARLRRVSPTARSPAAIILKGIPIRLGGRILRLACPTVFTELRCVIQLCAAVFAKHFITSVNSDRLCRFYPA